MRETGDNINTKRHSDVPIFMFAILAIGIAFTAWAIQLEDKRMRGEFLIQARILERAINAKRVLSLSGSEADLNSLDYKFLKEQLAQARSANPQCRFTYLMGQRPSGEVFFFVDSEPQDSRDYSPPGQVYSEITQSLLNVFLTGEDTVEGPVSDRWGRWVSALVAVVNPETGKTIAVLGMDIDARNWTALIIYHSFLPAVATILIFILWANFLRMQRRKEREKIRLAASQIALQDSEENFQQLFENMADGLAIYQAVDEGGDFVFVNLNKAGEEISQIERKDIIGRRVTEVFPEVAKIGLLEVLRRVWSTGVSEYLPGAFYKDKRIEHWTENYVLRLPSGLIVAIYSNITDRKQAEEIVKESEERFRTLFDSTKDGILVADIETRQFIMHNRIICEMLGYTKEEMKHISVEDIHPEKDLPYVVEQFGKLAREEIKIAPDLPVKRKDGSVFYADVGAALITLAGKKYLMGSFRNITERRQAEEALKESEMRYRVIYETSADAIMTLTPEEGFLSGNPATLRMFRCRDEKDFIQCGPADLSPEYQIDGRLSTVKAQEMMAIALKKGSHFFEWVHRRKDGTDFFATVLLTRLVLKDKQLLQATVRDITAYKQAEEDLRRTKQRMEFILGVTKTGLDIIDCNFNMLYIDPGWARVYGDHCGKKCFEYFMGRKEVCPNCGILKALETKKPFIAEEILVRENNRPVQVTTIPFQNEKGEWLVAEINVDISERKKLERSQRLMELGKLVSSIAHEVNNPLMVISGNAQLCLMEEIQSEAVKENLQIIIEECQRARDIVRRLLKFARPTKGEIKQVDINKSIEAVVGIMEHQFKLANVAVKINYLNHPPLILMDEKQIQEVIMNLINNASEAMPGGGTITITISLEGDFLRLDFKDTGCGMSEEVQKKLTEPFFTTKEKGTGLGLSVCESIVKAHKGELKFESQTGKGTTVTVLLPLGEG